MLICRDDGAPTGRPTGSGGTEVAINISAQAREKLIEILGSPKNEGHKIRVVFEGFG